jgi:peptide/nickel transport system permease protein
MRRYIARRIVQNLFILWALVTVMFFLFRLIPGDPTSTVISGELTESARQRLLEAWGLDRPLHVQYIVYLRNLLSGDFGLSFYHQAPVWDTLAEKVVNTLILMIPATLLGTLAGALIGVAFGWWRGSWAERLGVLVPPIIRGMPVFWLGVLLLMVFSYTWGLFPHAGMRSLGAPSGGWLGTYFSRDFLWHLVLPFACTAITSLPEPMLIMRSSLLEVRGEDFLELVEAKGVSEWVVLRHAVRNSLLPIVTWVFHMLGYAMASTVLVEVVFAWPGLGRELVVAIENYDYPVSQAAFFLISAIIIGLNFLNDLLYGVLDPRVSLE